MAMQEDVDRVAPKIDHWILSLTLSDSCAQWSTLLLEWGEQ